ncbi:MAG: NAD(P)/FAD-dependent oxidoreductase [Dehalococcoidia bacterium]
MSEFDLAVIGAGSGLEVASSAAGHGWRVAVIDEGPFGGTCLNHGCIPSKMLIHSADVMETIRGAERFGINVTVNSVDWAAIVNRVSATIDEDARRTEHAVSESQNMQVFRSRARFLSPFELQVGDEHVAARHVVIAAGSRPRVIKVEGIEETPYVTSDDAMRLSEQPGSLIIVGGGAVAVELAHFFGALGTAVTLIARGDRLLSGADREISEAFTASAAKKFDVRVGREVVSVTRRGTAISVTVRSPDGLETVEAEQLLLAAGRIPNTDLLEVDRAGIAVDDRGFLKTDDFLQTSVPDVWALGDIAGRFMLKHSANLEALFVAHNMLHPDNRLRMNYHAMPQAIFSSPQVAGVGETEQSLRTQGRE